MTLKTSSPSPSSFIWENWSWETVCPPPTAARWQSEPCSSDLDHSMDHFPMICHSWSQHLHPCDVSQVYPTSFLCPYILYLPSWVPLLYLQAKRSHCWPQNKKKNKQINLSQGKDWKPIATMVSCLPMALCYFLYIYIQCHVVWFK